MASQVLSGSSNVSYTNNTGQNVRIVINFMRGTLQRTSTGSIDTIQMSWAGVSASAQLGSIGRNLAFYSFHNATSIGSFGAASDSSSGNNAYSTDFGGGALPTELMLAPGQTFTATCGAYNIVVIPEAG